MTERDKVEREKTEGDSGFSILEVAVASVVSMTGLVVLAGLFTLALTQNRMNKQYSSTTALAQQKLEELNAIERNDARLTVGGSLDEASKQNAYYEDVYVDDAGTVTTVIPAGQTANYRRYWRVETDPQLDRTVIISVRTVSRQASRKVPEESTLTTVRSW